MGTPDNLHLGEVGRLSYSREACEDAGFLPFAVDDFADQDGGKRHKAEWDSRGRYVLRSDRGRCFGTDAGAGAGAPVAEEPRICSIPKCGAEYVSVRAYKAPNWATTDGVMRKRRQIERKGLPGFHGWKFLTLTLDQSNFEGPLDGFLKGRARMAKFLHLMRAEGIICADTKWCWKLEFHKSGWAHWHMLIDWRPKWSHDQLKRIQDLWGKGSTHVEAVRTDDFLYSFKYAFKPVLAVDEQELFGGGSFCLPAWFLDYTATKVVRVEWEEGGEKKVSHEEKPCGFGRVRFWQTSKGFYTGVDDQKRDADKSPTSCFVSLPVRVTADRQGSTVQIVSRGLNGDYESSAVIVLNVPFSILTRDITWQIFNGEAHGLAVGNYVCPVETITNRTNQKWRVHQIAAKNCLHPALAEQLPDRNWKTY